MIELGSFVEAAEDVDEMTLSDVDDDDDDVKVGLLLDVSVSGKNWLLVVDDNDVVEWVVIIWVDVSGSWMVVVVVGVVVVMEVVVAVIRRAISIWSMPKCPHVKKELDFLRNWILTFI